MVNELRNIIPDIRRYHQNRLRRDHDRNAGRGQRKAIDADADVVDPIAFIAAKTVSDRLFHRGFLIHPPWPGSEIGTICILSATTTLRQGQGPKVHQVLDSARRHGRHAAVLYLDLDEFKPVNDRHGHATGDLLLRQVAQRLQAAVRSEDTVSRFGGDEFGIVLAEVAQPQDCEQVAAKVLAALAQPFELEGGVTARISASVGAALFPDHGHDMTTLVAHADTAMYAAKNAGRNRFSWAEPANAPPRS